MGAVQELGAVPCSDDSDVQDSGKESGDGSVHENYVASASSFFFPGPQEREKKPYSSTSSVQDSTSEGNDRKVDKKRSINSTESKSNKRSKESDNQEIVNALSKIAESFMNNPIFSDNTMCVFKDIADMREKEEPMVFLPSIMVRLIIRILDLEKEAQNK